MEPLSIVLKTSSWNKATLLCEMEDKGLSFKEDIGAIGRIGVQSDSITIDFKGNQYRGYLRHGPSILVLNTAPHVGQTRNIGTSSHVIKVESYVNEFCQFKFEKDVLGSMSGPIGGVMETFVDSQGIFSEYDNDHEYQSGGGGDDDDDDDVNDTDKLVQKKAPKISTITQRKRKGEKKDKRVKKVAKKK